MPPGAMRILRADGRLLEAYIECDTNATFGGRPKRLTSSAAISAISASSSALGSSLTKVSAMNSVCCSSISAFMAAMVGTPDFAPMTLRTCSRWAS